MSLAVLTVPFVLAWIVFFALEYWGYHNQVVEIGVHSLALHASAVAMRHFHLDAELALHSGAYVLGVGLAWVADFPAQTLIHRLRVNRSRK